MQTVGIANGMRSYMDYRGASAEQLSDGWFRSLAICQHGNVISRFQALGNTLYLAFRSAQLAPVAVASHFACQDLVIVHISNKQCSMLATFWISLQQLTHIWQFTHSFVEKYEVHPVKHTTWREINPAFTFDERAELIAYEGWQAAWRSGIELPRRVVVSIKSFDIAFRTHIGKLQMAIMVEDIGHIVGRAHLAAINVHIWHKLYRHLSLMQLWRY